MSRITVILSVLLLLAVPGFAQTPAEDAAQGLREFAALLDRLGSLDVLDQQVPLISQSVGEAFGLDRLFGDTLGSLPDPGSLADLETLIGNAGTTLGGVTITFQSPSVAATGDGFVDISFTVQVDATDIGLPLDVPVLAGAVEEQLAGGGAPTDLNLTLPLAFRLDTTLADAAERFFLDYGVSPPAMTVNVDAMGGTSFSANLGFVELDVAPAFSFDFDFVAQLNDPDSDGQITLGEITTTDVVDLFDLSLANQVCPDDSGSAIATASLTLTEPSGLIPGSSTLRYSQSCFQDGFEVGRNNVVADWTNNIREFIANLSPSNVLQGLAVLGAALRSTQIAGDLPIPFVQQDMAQVFSFAEPVFDFVGQFDDAAIVCGPIDDDPPRGNLLDVTPGVDTIYCQAITFEDPQPDSVQWGTGTPGTAASDATVGPNPTENFAFPVTGTAVPDFVVRFEDSEGVRTVHRRFLSVQELRQQLIDGVLGSFDSVPDLVAFDDTNDVLTLHLRRSFTPSVPDDLDLRFDFGDQLQERTSISGLGASGSASVTLTPGMVTLDVIVGVEVGDIFDVGFSDPGMPEDPQTPDRFFIQSPGGPLLALDGLTSDFNVALRGMIGLLEIEATSPGGFTLGQQNGNPDPIISLDLDYTGADSVGNLTSAIRFRQLFRELTARDGGTQPGRIQPAFNLGFTGGLDVQATGAGLELASGSVTLDWQISDTDDITLGPTIDPAFDFNENLKVFDLEPALFGSHTGSDGTVDEAGSIADQLTDSNQNAFSADLAGATLRNLDDGSQCVIPPGDASSSGLDCLLEGGVDNRWETGDRYKVGGNPRAVLSALLDSLELVFDALLASDLEFLEEEIPLIGRSPRQLIAQIESVKDQLDQFRALRPLGSVVCRQESGGEMFGVLALRQNDTFQCQALNLLPVGSPADLEVQWECLDVGDSGASCQVIANDDDPTTVATDSMPGSSVTFQINGGGTDSDGDGEEDTFDLGDDFTVRVTFSDDNGDHPLNLPPTGLSLQNLDELLACQLGIPEGVISLSLTPDPSDPVLGVGLNYGICTTDHPDTDDCAGRFDIGRFSGRLRLPLENLLAGLELASLDVGDTQLDLAIKAGARFEAEIPLLDPTAASIADTSGLDFEVLANATGASVTAGLGPIMLSAGGLARAGAGFATTFDGTSFSATLGSLGDPQVCGSVSNTVAGSHTGAGAGDGGGALGPDDLIFADGFESGDVAAWGPAETTRAKLRAETKAEDTDLTDSGADFSDDLVGETLTNTTQGWSCTIASTTATSLTCDDNMGNSWDMGDEYEVVLASSPIEGDACAALTLTANEDVLGQLGWSFEFGRDPATEIFQPPDLLANLAGSLIDLALLFEFLPTVLDNVSGALESADSLPLIGEGLAEIGNATGEINDRFVTPLADAVVDTLTGRVADLETDLAQFIFDSVPAGQDLIVGGVDGITVTGFCSGNGTVDCEDPDDMDMGGDEVQDLERLQVRVVLGQFGEPDPNAEGAAQGADPFEAGAPLELDFGIPGVPIEATGNLDLTYGWRLALTFGVDKTLGPFIVANAADSVPIDSASSNTGFRIGANVQVAARDLVELDACRDLPGAFPVSGDYSQERCINARLGFLDTYLYDRADDDERSRLALFAFTNLKSTDDDNVVPLCELLSGTTLEAGVRAEGNLAFAFQTGISGSLAEDFPSVLGTVELAAGFGFPRDPDADGLQTADYGDLHLDLGNFVSGLIQEPAEQIKSFTSPLKPVVDTVRAPLPVVSDLAQMVGQDPITLLSLVELQNCPPPGPNRPCTKLIRTLLELIDFVNNFDLGDENVLIALGSGVEGGDPGSFSIDVDMVRLEGIQTPDRAGRLIDTSTATSSRITSASASSTPSSLTFPFLADSSQIFNLLMGEDITLVRFDAGTLEVGAGFSYTYGPFFVGPVPVSVNIGGSVTLQARFAMGYDTSGIRQAFDTGFGGIIDGVFVDDLASSGEDVPEISLIGEVSAGAGVDIGFAAAGIRGGITFTTALDLDDRPDPDGKLRIEEIVDKLDNPLCLFVLNGKLEAFLAGWVRVGFEWFSKEWDIDFVRVTLLEFEVKCEPPPPRLADTNSSDSGSLPDGVPANVLRLNLGSQSLRDRRGVRKSVINEKVVVRQTGARSFEVTGFGLTQDFNVPGGGPITVWARGDDGKDDIALVDGVDLEDNVIVFTANADIHGGSDNDTIKTANGADLVCGGSGNDRIETGPGADRVGGGAGGDNISGEGGVDLLFGDGESDSQLACADSIDDDDDDEDNDSGNDVITGGAGGDTLEGGGGDDNLNGGWAATAAAFDEAPCTDSGVDPVEDPRCDSGDVILGGTGDDVIEGRFGDDVLYGDLESDGLDRTTAASTSVALMHLQASFCDAGDGDGGRDRIQGGPGDDRIWGGSNPFDTEALLRHEVLGGQEGNDFICGNGGSDVIDGDDTLVTASQCTDDCHDHLFGGPGDDGLFGRVGNDRLFGGSGNDELFGDEGADDLGGGPGRDLIFGDAGNDVLLGEGEGNSLLTPTVYPTRADRGGLAGAPPLDSGFLLSGVDLPDGDRAGPIPDCFLEGDGTVVPRIDLAEGNLVGVDGNADCLFGGTGHDLLFGGDGDDQVFGDLGDDFAEGNNGDDVMRGGKGDDVLYGHERVGDTDWRLPSTTGVSYTMLADADQMFGDSGEDDLYGGPDDDEIRGNADSDYLEGNQDLAAGDRLFGDGDEDDLIGGSSLAGIDDGGDELFGNAGHDVLLGDNGTLVRTGGINSADGSAVRVIALLDTADLVGDAEVGGTDTMSGNPGNDLMFGGPGGDTMHGNAGDDHLEGNNGVDTLFGNLGQDDLIGGTGRLVSNDPASAADGRPDGVDTIYGGDGDNGEDLDDDYDVIAGDNATIDRPTDGGQWIVNSFNDGVERDVTLFDVAGVGSPAAAGTSGGDDLFGEAEDDLMWGQGGGDTMDGGAGFDTMMGNDGSDVMFGGPGNDDMTGGTGRINDDDAMGVAARLDTGDEMHGGDGFDVMAGDNAVLARSLVDGSWVEHSFDMGTRHDHCVEGSLRACRILLDVDSVNSALVSGVDTMFGDDENDVMFGQGAGDIMQGGDGDDFMEGNADRDTMNGNADQDDMIGGTVMAGVSDDGDPLNDDRGDLMHGDGQGDVLLGDNGVILRPLELDDADVEVWQTDLNTANVVRRERLFDVLLAGGTPDETLSGGDLMHGDDGADRLFGQAGRDRMQGGGGADVMEGNHDADVMYGDCAPDTTCGAPGEDDMIGGGSATDGVIVPTSVGNQLADGDDEMFGGGDGDVMTGDNGRITRVTQVVDGDDLWIVDPNSQDVFRDVALFDVALADGSGALAGTAGSDAMSGQSGRDLMFGQGNADPDDDDNDGRRSEDPYGPDGDGIDNDRDGRESPASTGFDCLDGRDNDGNGLIDFAEPGCVAAIDEDGGGDVMTGGPGDDYMEGNAGGDLMFGDDGEDDMIGGSSAGIDTVNQGSFVPGIVPDSDPPGLVAGRVPPAGLADVGDLIEGGGEDDLIAADNAVVIRPTTETGLWMTIAGGIHQLTVRQTVMAMLPEDDGAFGDDYALGDAGDDEIYGQQGDDFLLGAAGDDVLVGDLGQVTSGVEDGSRETTITSNSPFFFDTVFRADSVFRLTELYSFEDGDGAEGNDTLLGGDGDDSLHAGPGEDLANGDGDGIATLICEDPFLDPDPGTVDEDHVFGGDGNDALWGGRGHDHLWGGHGDDHLDVKPREIRQGNRPQDPAGPADPPEWHTYGAPDNFQGLDLLYGGFDRDAMQADEGGAGPTEGDRMVDWAGGFNVFYVCPPEYGEGYISRLPAPDIESFLQTLSASDGALATATEGTSGFRELGYVFTRDIRFNSHPPHADHPGHFTCDCETLESLTAVPTGDKE